MESSNKKILMLLENNRYPQDPRVRREANSLIAAGFQLSLIAPKGKTQPWSETIDGVHVYRFPMPPDADGFIGYVVEFGFALIMMFIWTVFVLFRRGFHVIHAHNPPDVLVLIAIIFKLIGKKFIFDHHDLSPELYNAKANGQGNATVIKALRFFEKLTFRFANRVVSTNESYKEIAMVRGNVPEEKITIVRNGPLLETLSDVEPDPEIVQRATNRIGYIGQIEHQDGLDYLIRAVGHIVNDFDEKDILLVLIGRGNAVDSLKAQTESLGLQDNIYFAGFQPESVWRPMLAGVHIGAVPDPLNDFNSRSTMIKITDYMGLRKPVVAFDLREHRYTAGDSALYAEPNDEMEFAKHIMALLKDPQQQEQMGNAGYERVSSELAWEFQAERLVAMYRDLLS